MGYEQGFEEGLPESTQADDFSDYTEPQDARTVWRNRRGALESGWRAAPSTVTGSNSGIDPVFKAQQKTRLGSERNWE